MAKHNQTVLETHIWDSLRIAKPVIEDICSNPQLQYDGGPAGVIVIVKHIALPDTMTMIYGDLVKLPRPRWDCDFEAIAHQKLQVALQNGRPTSEVVKLRPWLLHERFDSFGL